ncbi:MAG: hypothetical protein GX489_05025 [Firmicutes bacterium]|nr:hypothetical protein [Bacillota bacterium]
MDLIALILFIVVIAVSFFRKSNAGILAFAIGAIAVRIFSLTDKDLLGAISTSMFTILVGITLLFAAINSTGALELLAKKIVALAGDRVWIIPIAIYAAGFTIAGIGPGAIPALAIIPGLAVSVAVAVGYDPLMLALIGECGLMAGRMTPITPEGALITEVAASAGIENVMPAILVSKTLVTIIFSVVLFIIFKGYKLTKPQNKMDFKSLEKFNGKQLIALSSIVVLMILLIFFKVNIGLAAFISAAALFIIGVADDGACIKAMPWSTIVMVMGMGTLLSIVDTVGGIDLMSTALSSIMSASTAAPIMGISAGLLSMVSSALGVVYPTMMPMCASIANQLGNVHPVALMAAVGAGGSLSGITPLSTGGALALAALGSNLKDFDKDKESKAFVQLFIIAGIGLLITAIVSALFFNFIANTIMG